jgi:hypothetical protein
VALEGCGWLQEPWGTSAVAGGLGSTGWPRPSRVALRVAGGHEGPDLHDVSCPFGLIVIKVYLLPFESDHRVPAFHRKLCPYATVMVGENVMVESGERRDLERDGIGTLAPHVGAVGAARLVGVLGVHQVSFLIVAAVGAGAFRAGKKKWRNVRT